MLLYLGGRAEKLIDLYTISNSDMKVRNLIHSSDTMTQQFQLSNSNFNMLFLKTLVKKYGMLIFNLPLRRKKYLVTGLI